MSHIQVQLRIPMKQQPNQSDRQYVRYAYQSGPQRILLESVNTLKYHINDNVRNNGANNKEIHTQL